MKKITQKDVDKAWKDWNKLIMKIQNMKVGENIVFNHSSGIYNLIKTEEVSIEDSEVKE